MCRKSIEIVKNALGVGVGVVTAKKVSEAGYNEVVQIGAGAAGYGITYGVSSLIANLVDRVVISVKAKKLANDLMDEFDDDFDDLFDDGDDVEESEPVPQWTPDQETEIPVNDEKKVEPDASTPDETTETEDKVDEYEPDASTPDETAATEDKVDETVQAINKAAEAAKSKKDEKRQKMNAAKPKKEPFKVDDLECEQ